jgi:hypothetical protein
MERKRAHVVSFNVRCAVVVPVHNRPLQPENSIPNEISDSYCVGNHIAPGVAKGLYDINRRNRVQPAIVEIVLYDYANRAVCRLVRCFP